MPRQKGQRITMSLLHLVFFLVLLWSNLIRDDIEAVISYPHMLLFVADVKLFKLLVNESDSEEMFALSTSFTEWSQVNGLGLNTKNCFTLPFSRSLSRFR